MSDILFKAVQGQVNIDEAKGIVECFVAGVGNKDSVGDVVLPGAFTASLRRRKPRVVWGHDWNQPIGKVLDIFEVPSTDPRLPMKMKQAGIGGLFARVQFNLKSERGREAFASVAFFGEDQEWSIGYKTLDAIYDNERKANLLREVELYEVSPVLHGANQLTGTISIKSEKQDSVSSFQKSKWKMFDREFARRIKEDYPEIWKKGGNIKGNAQYEILTKIAEQGGEAKTQDQINALELREAWVARHAGDFRLAGVVAQMKWLAVGSRGEDHMKKVVNEAIKKMKMNEKSLDWDEEDDEDMEMSDSEKGFGKPNKEKLQALMDAVLKAADEMDEDVELSDEDFDDTEMKDKFWKLRRLLGMSPGSSVDGPVMARPVWDDEWDEDDGDIMPMKKPGGCGCGCGGKSSCVVDDAEYALKFIDDFGMEQKAGRVLSTNNMQKLQNAIELLKEVLAAGGRQDIEMKEKDALFIDADMGELFGLKELIDPILEYHFVDAEVLENGIFVKSDNYEVEDAINTALSHYFSGGIEYKGLGGRIGRAARRVNIGGGGRGGRGRRMFDRNARFDPNASDADGDGTIQEGTQFARRATSKPAPKKKPSVFSDGFDARPTRRETREFNRALKPRAGQNLDEVTVADRKLSRELVKLLGKEGEMRVVSSNEPYDVVKKIRDPKKRAAAKRALDDFYSVYKPRNYALPDGPAATLSEAFDIGMFNPERNDIKERMRDAVEAATESFAKNNRLFKFTGQDDTAELEPDEFVGALMQLQELFGINSNMLDYGFYDQFEYDDVYDKRTLGPNYDKYMKKYGKKPNAPKTEPKKSSEGKVDRGTVDWDKPGGLDDGMGWDLYDWRSSNGDMYVYQFNYEKNPMPFEIYVERGGKRIYEASFTMPKNDEEKGKEKAKQILKDFNAGKIDSKPQKNEPKMPAEVTKINVQIEGIQEEIDRLNNILEGNRSSGTVPNPNMLTQLRDNEQTLNGLKKRRQQIIDNRD